jgi:hypothetical protein
MEHDDGHVAVAAPRHHVADVHLVDGDVSAGGEIAHLALRLFDHLAADEEAALRLQHQRCGSQLDVCEGLRRHAERRAEHGRHEDAGQHGRSPPPGSSLISHRVIFSRNSLTLGMRRHATRTVFIVAAAETGRIGESSEIIGQSCKQWRAFQ